MRPKARNEYRQIQDCEYSRGRRRNKVKYLLSYDWHEKYHKRRNWKHKRKTQYRDKPRGERYEMEFDETFWRRKWRLESYLKDHKIAYRIEHICESYTYERTIRTKRVKDRQVPVFLTLWRFNESNNIVRYHGHQIGFKWEYKDVPLDKPYVKKYTGSITKGYKLSWWSDKDIGIEYILKRIERR